MERSYLGEPANLHRGNINFPQIISCGFAAVLKIFHPKDDLLPKFEGGKRRRGWEFGLVCVPFRDTLLISRFSPSPGWNPLALSPEPSLGLDVLLGKLHPNPFLLP